jgi:hypothetical protein
VMFLKQSLVLFSDPLVRLQDISHHRNFHEKPPPNRSRFTVHC